MEQYFGDKISVKKRDLIESFEGKIWDTNDDNPLKFTILYFIHICLFWPGEKIYSKIVSRNHFNLIESDQHKDRSWGKKAFYRLLKSISKKMIFLKKYYIIHGISFAMQVWLYECSFSVDLKISERVANRISRLLNQKTSNAHPRYKSLIRDIFSDVNNKVIN